MPSENEFWKRANVMVAHLDSIITTNYVFFSLSLTKLEKQSANDFYIGNLLCLPHSLKMNNKKTPSSSLVTHFHIYKCRFIYTSILQRWQNKRPCHFFFLNWNNKSAAWSKKGTEEERDSSSQQRPCHMVDPPVPFSVCRIWHPCCLSSFRNSNEINTMIHLLSVLTQRRILITIFFLLFVNMRFAEIPAAAPTWLNKSWK